MLTRPESPAIFQADGSRYEADSCIPLMEALDSGRIKGAAWSRGQYPGTRLQADQLPGICSIGCWDAEQDQDWYIPPHRNEGIELSVVLSGSVRFEAGTVSESLTRGRVALTAPWQEHCVGRPAITTSRLLYLIVDVGVRRPNATWIWPDWFPASDRDRAALAGDIIRCPHPVFSAPPDMMWAFDRMFDLLTDSSADADAATMCLLAGLVLNGLAKVLAVQPHCGATLSDTHHAVKLFLSGLCRHLDHPWRLDEMAGQCGLSRSRMTEVCFELTNKTPIDYLNEQRLRHAATLLAEDGSRSITAIAFDCGFASSQYFSRRFSRRFGVSPSGWQRRHRESGRAH